jgi:hypothetical protein
MTRGRLTIMDRVKNMAEEKRPSHNAIIEESDPPPDQGSYRDVDYRWNSPDQGEELGGSRRIPALLKASGPRL